MSDKKKTVLVGRYRMIELGRKTVYHVGYDDAGNESIRLAFVVRVQQDAQGRLSFYHREMGRCPITLHVDGTTYLYNYTRTERSRIRHRKETRRT